MAGYRADTDRLEELIELELEPATQRTRDDLDTVRHQADRADREAALQFEVASLTQAHDQAVLAIDALRSSWSWRLSYPLRVLGRLALQLRSHAPRR